MAAKPVGAWNFSLSLLDAASAAATVVSVTMGSRPPQSGFSECTGLEATMAVEDYREGGRNDTVLHFPGRVSWAPLRLRRGVSADNSLLAWLASFSEGKGKRRDGVITLLNDVREPVRTWRFQRGLPTKWTGPTFDATKSAVAVEELEIQHEGIRLEGGGAVSQIAGAIGSLARTLGG
jgi:phage tail-like protein